MMWTLGGCYEGLNEIACEKSFSTLTQSRCSLCISFLPSSLDKDWAFSLMAKSTDSSTGGLSLKSSLIIYYYMSLDKLLKWQFP